jgi:hypothetical protein
MGCGGCSTPSIFSFVLPYLGGLFSGNLKAYQLPGLFLEELLYSMV